VGTCHCGQIKNRVNAVREFFTRSDIFGLIDGDNKNNDQISNLKARKCFSIPFAQHEHFYILPEVLENYIKSETNKNIISDVSEVLIDVIKNANDFSRHDQDEEVRLRKISKEITSDKVLDFFKVYRGKDLIQRIEGKIKIQDLRSKILGQQSSVHIIEKYLKGIKDEMKEIAFPIASNQTTPPAQPN